MSFRLADKVLRVDGREAPLTAPVKVILTGLASYANDDGTHARPSVDTLSRATSLTERTVQRALRELERMNLIVEVTPATRYTPTVYSINVRAIDALPKIKQGRQTDTPQGRQKVTSGVKESRRRGDSQSARGDRVSPDSILNSIQDSIPHSGRVGDEDAFETFWKAYPKQVAEAEARKAWAGLNPDAALLAEVLKAIADQRRSPQWTKERGRFIPEPARWLEGKRWKDVAPTVEPPTGGGALAMCPKCRQVINRDRPCPRCFPEGGGWIR